MCKVFIQGLLIICAVLLAGGMNYSVDGISWEMEKAAAAPAKPAGIPAGGKGTTEAAAVAMMKQEAFKKVLNQLTAWSDDPNSPYQQLLGRYREFVGKEVIRKHGKGAAGCFVLGNVPVNVDLLQQELSKMVKAERKKDEDARTVYLLVRFTGTQNQMMEEAAERLILDRYNTRLRESGFEVADEDALLKKLSTYHGLTYEPFVAKVKEELENDVEVQIAVVGEINQTALEQDETGVTATCDIKICAYDCSHDFKVIANYEGSDVIRRNTRDEVGKLLLEKAAITSSKAITDRLVRYWKN